MNYEIYKALRPVLAHAKNRGPDDGYTWLYLIPYPDALGYMATDGVSLVLVKDRLAKGDEVSGVSPEALASWHKSRGMATPDLVTRASGGLLVDPVNLLDQARVGLARDHQAAPGTIGINARLLAQCAGVFEALAKTYRAAMVPSRLHLSTDPLHPIVLQGEICSRDQDLEVEAIIMPMRLEK